MGLAALGQPDAHVCKMNLGVLKELLSAYPVATAVFPFSCLCSVRLKELGAGAVMNCRVNVGVLKELLSAYPVACGLTVSLSV